MDSEIIRVLKAYLKTRKDMAPVLFRSKKGRPLCPDSKLDRLFKGYASKARLPKDKHHFHVLKHSCATHLLEMSKDVVFGTEVVGAQGNQEYDGLR